MTEKENLELIKEDVNLVTLIDLKGIALRKTGKGCHGLSFTHNNIKKPCISVCNTKAHEPQPKNSSIRNRKLLAKTTHYHKHNRNQSLPRAASKTNSFTHEQCTAKNQTITDFGKGHANRTLSDHLQDNEEIKTRKKTGIFGHNIHKFFYYCVTLVLYYINSIILNIHGRNFNDHSPVPVHVPLFRKDIANSLTLKRSSNITISIINALTLYVQGLKNIILTNSEDLSKHRFLNHKNTEPCIINSINKGTTRAETLNLQLKEKIPLSYDPLGNGYPLFFKKATPLNILRWYSNREKSVYRIQLDNTCLKPGETQIIDQDKLKTIKQDVDLKTLIKFRDIILKKKNKACKRLCPLYNNTKQSLSLTPETNLWNCFVRRLCIQLCS